MPKIGSAGMSPRLSPVPGSPAWWADRPAAVTAQRRGRPPLEVGRIVATALKLVDQVGVQAFSLRMLADALGSGTATLYRHFASKDELMAYVVDRVLGEVAIPDLGDIDDWREAMRRGADVFYETLRRHPQVLPLLVAQVPVGPHGLAQRERVIALLLAYGFPVDLAARAFTAIGHYVIGFAAQQHGPGAADPESGPELREYYQKLDANTYPAIRSAAEALTSVPLDEEFRFGLDLILAGLETARNPTA
jgi:AcrR family transcriptional regulator